MIVYGATAAFGEQGPPHLGAVDVDAFGLRRSGESVQGPLGRDGRLGGDQFTCFGANWPARWGAVSPGRSAGSGRLRSAGVGAAGSADHRGRPDPLR
jgi:hypothetical protein